MIKICIVGAAGRMGRNIAAAAYEDKEVEVSGASDRNGSEYIGTPVNELAGCGKGGAVIDCDLVKCSEFADVLIDFTGADATFSNLPLYEKVNKPVVIGSTGFSGEQKIAVEKLALKIPVIMAPNMSLGVNVALKLIEQAAALLKGYDIELVETHHRMKKDAPSGTALAMAAAAAKGAEMDLSKHAVYSRHGIIGERKSDEIGVQTLRGGDVAGDHTVFFLGIGERIEITHRAGSGKVFAIGALRAAKWLYGREAGLYDMSDVLGLK